MSAVTELRDVILRDGTHAAPAAAARGGRRGAARVLRGALRAEPLPALPRPAGARTRGSSSRCSSPTGPSSGALVGALGEPGEERVVALASYARLREPARRPRSPSPSPTTSRAAASARACSSSSRRSRGEAGIERFVAEVLPRERGRCSRVFEDAGFERRARARGRRGRGALPDRGDRRATGSAWTSATTSRVVASLRPFFEPALGRRDRRVARGAARSAASSSATSSTADFTGAAYPGQPRGRAGRRRARATARSRRSRTTSTSPSSACPASSVLDAAEDGAASTGVRALCVISAGFAEIGARGHASARSELLALVRAHGARLVGPNCLGIAVGRASA